MLDIINDTRISVNALCGKCQNKIGDSEPTDQLKIKANLIIENFLSEMRHVKRSDLTNQDVINVLQIKNDIERIQILFDDVFLNKLNYLFAEIEISSIELGVINQCFCLMTDDENDEFIEEFREIEPEKIEHLVNSKIIDISAPEETRESPDFIDHVLETLDGVKDRLGGSPNFPSDKPSINETEKTKTFLGVPLPAVKDWLVMVLKEGWRPVIFWVNIARLFNVSAQNQLSQYEEAYIRILRYGLLIANKERFIDILDQQDDSRFGELGAITGLAWHPKDNPAAVERIYIEFVETFLTDFFERAKNGGEEALVDYFNAFKGVCFEDRARYLEEYAKSNPLNAEDSSLGESLDNIIDINTSLPVYHVLNQIGSQLMKANMELTTEQFWTEINNNEILECEFPRESTGVKSRPTVLELHNYILENIEFFVIAPYPIEDFLEIEYRIYQEASLEKSREGFLASLQAREGMNQGEFSVDMPAVEEFISRKQW